MFCLKSFGKCLFKKYVSINKTLYINLNYYFAKRIYLKSCISNRVSNRKVEKRLAISLTFYGCLVLFSIAFYLVLGLFILTLLGYTVR